MKAVRPAVPRNPPVLDAKRAQKLGAAALKETKIGGVIDATGKIRVLVIDPDSEAAGAGSGTSAALAFSLGLRGICGVPRQDGATRSPSDHSKDYFLLRRSN
jgi:hypothetical protein